MIKACDDLFDIIKLQFDLPNNTIPNFNDSRWVDGGNFEQKWLTYSMLKNKFQISHNVYFGLIEHYSDVYFFAIGYDDPTNLPPELTHYSLNSGLFTVLVSELGLPIKSDITNIFLEQNILSQSKSTPLYKGHDFNDLIKIFPNIYVAEINSTFTSKDNLHQIICAYLSANKEFLLLPFGQVNLDKIHDLVVINSLVLNYESILQALLSSTFKFAFLDLYRCIEMLYQIIYIDEAHNLLGLTINRSDFLVKIDKTLNWKPNERSTLTKLFSQTPLLHKQSFLKTIQLISRTTSENNACSWLYDLRCNIVHLKSMQTNIQLSPKDWQNIISGTLDLMSYWYSHYSTFN